MTGGTGVRQGQRDISLPVPPGHGVRAMAATWASAPTPLRHTAAAAVAGVVALGTCLPRLGTQPLSWDEAVTANAAARPYPALWHLLQHTDAPLGTYYAIMHAWMLSRPASVADEVWIRLPSALAAAAAVVLTAVLSARLWGPMTALISGCVLAVNPLFVFYAHDARPYALAVLAAVASTLALVAVVEAPTWLRAAGYTVLALVGIYLQLWLVLLVMAHALTVLLSRRTSPCLWVPYGVLVAGTIPLLIVSRRESHEIGWIPAPSVLSTLDFLDRLAGGAVAAALLVVAVAVTAQQRTDRPQPRDATGKRRARARTTLIGSWLAVPPIALIVISCWQPVLVPRYALICVPALAIAVAAGVRRLRGPIAFPVLILVLVLSAGTTAVQQTRAYKYENFRAAADAIVDTDRPGDALVYAPSSFRIGIRPYLRRAADDPRIATPADIALASATSPYQGSVIGGTELPSTILPGRVDDRARVYLIGSSYAALTDAKTGADADKGLALQLYQPVWAHTYGEVTVTLLVRRPGSSPDRPRGIRLTRPLSCS
jgi:mannosyltransferase